MKSDSWHFDTIAQNEALANEVKGALFEYLVAKELGSGAVRLSLTPELHDRLLHYESWLRQNDLDLVKFLPELGRQVARRLKDWINFKLEHVEVVGKLAGGSGHKSLHESDLILSGGGSEAFIGLKMCKADAYVNTKSAGIRSFIERYFGAFAQGRERQAALNSEVDLAFLKMGQALYEEAGIKTGFTGHFGVEWDALGLPHLPGQLPPAMRQHVLQFYRDLNSCLYLTLDELYRRDRALFGECLYPILGLGARNLVIAIAFVEVKRRAQGKNYTLKQVRIHSAREVERQLAPFRLAPWQPSLSSLEVALADWRLQIRMKPMNKFTVPAVKVNCSIKFGPEPSAQDTAPDSAEGSAGRPAGPALPGDLALSPDNRR